MVRETLTLDPLLSDATSADRARTAANATIPRLAWPTLAWAVFCFLGFWAAFVLGSHLDSVAAKAALGLTVSGYLVFSCFSISHEALHNNITRRSPSLRWLNDALGWTMGLLTFSSYPAFKATHHAHHRYTNHPEKDPNYWTLATGWRRWARVVLSLVYIRRQTFKFARDHDRPELIRYYYIHWAIALSLIITLSFVFSVIDVLALWILPALVSSWIAAFAVAIIPHGQSEAAPAEQVHTVALLPRGLQELVTVVLNGHNYHMLHHAFPAVPFYAYVGLGRKLQRLAPVSAPSDDAG